MNGFRDMVGFIWSVADLLRSDYEAAEYGKVILPLTVLRRAAKQEFYNVFPLDFRGLLADPEHIAQSLRLYIDAFSPGVVEVLEKYGFDDQITRPDESSPLYQVVARFADIDLHPDVVSNVEMGCVFEELIRNFCEAGNETGCSRRPRRPNSSPPWPAESSTSWPARPDGPVEVNPQADAASAGQPSGPGGRQCARTAGHHSPRNAA